MKNTSTYTLTIRELPDASDPGAIRRLRRLLKAMVRGYGLRCIGIKPAIPAEAKDEGDVKP